MAGSRSLREVADHREEGVVCLDNPAGVVGDGGPKDASLCEPPQTSHRSLGAGWPASPPAPSPFRPPHIVRGPFRGERGCASAAPRREGLHEVSHPLRFETSSTGLLTRRARREQEANRSPFCVCSERPQKSNAVMRGIITSLSTRSGGQARAEARAAWPSPTTRFPVRLEKSRE